MPSSTVDHATSYLLRPRFLAGCVVLVALVRFVNLGFLDLQAWDEGLYALRSASIVHFGDWLDQTPYVPGGLATSCYPPLTFWTSAALYKVFGASEWTTRLTSALCGAGSVLLIVLFTRRFASKSAAMFAGLLFGTNLFYTFFSRQGQLDVPYVFFLLLALYGWSVWAGGVRMRGLGLIALGTWGAFMSKILVGFYVPLILLLLQAVEMRRGWRWRSVFEISAALAVGLVLALPWHLFMYLRHGSAFMDAFFGLHLVQRLTSPIEGHDPALGIFFYVNQVVVQYPEASLGIGLIFLVLRGRIEPGAIALPLVIASTVWSVVVFLIITVMATKIQQYMLPLSVPVAILGGLSLDLLAERKLTGRSRLIVIALLSVGTLWSALWPLRAYIKNGLLGIAGTSPYTTIPWGMVMVSLVCVSYCTSLIVGSRSGSAPDRAPIFVGSLLMLLMVRLVTEVVVIDQTQYNAGAKDMASLVREERAQCVMYLGRDLNPALDLYLKGWDEWRTDIRLDYYLCESTALAPQRKDLVFPRPNEATFLVEETRIANKECYSNLTFLKDNHPVRFANRTYRVYNLSGK